MVNLINTLLLYLLLFWGLFYLIVYGLSGYIGCLYSKKNSPSGDPRSHDYLWRPEQKLYSSMLRLNLNGDLMLAWLKLTLISFILGFCVMVAEEWLAFVRCGVSPLKSFVLLPWDRLFNNFISYFTNTGWDNGYHAVLEDSRGQLLVLMPLSWLNAASWISLAVILAEAVLTKDVICSAGKFYAYLVRSLFGLLLPLMAVITALFVLIDDGSFSRIGGGESETLSAQSMASSGYLAYLKRHHLLDYHLGKKQPEKNDLALKNQPTLFENEIDGIDGHRESDLSFDSTYLPLKSRHYNLINFIKDHSKTLHKMQRWRSILSAKTDVWWHAFCKASDLVTSSGRLAILPDADLQNPLSARQQLTIFIYLVGALLLPALLTTLPCVYMGKSSGKNSILILMMIMFSVKAIAIASSEWRQFGAELAGQIAASQSYLQTKILLWTQAASASATSLGNWVLDPNTLSVGSKLISTISLILGNLIWGSNGMGLINMLLYLLFSMALLELMVAKSTRLTTKVLKLSGVVWLMLIITLPSLIAMFFTLPELFVVPSAPGSLKRLIPSFYYYLSMFQNNGTVLSFSFSRFSLWLGSLGMLMGHFLTGLVTIFLIKRLAAQPLENKRMSLLLDHPLRALGMLFFNIALNLLTVSPILMLGLV